MSTMLIANMVLNETTLTGSKRLVMLSMCDSMAVVSLSTAARWTNLGDEGTAKVIDEMVHEGWFIEVDGQLIQPQLWKAIHEDSRPLRRTDAEKRRDKFKLSSSRRLQIYEKDGHKCHYCGNPEHLTIDHRLPISRGGSDDDDNLVACCKSCNSSKGTKSYDEFIAWRLENA